MGRGPHPLRPQAGETAFGVAFFPSDPALLARAEKAALALGLPFRRGVVATGDRFLAQREEAERLRALHGADAVEMEGPRPSWWPGASATPWSSCAW